MMTTGQAVIFGIRDVKPIVNIPQDAEKVRLRLRAKGAAKAFVKFKDRIEEWIICPTGNVTGADTWEIRFKQGENRFTK